MTRVLVHEWASGGGRLGRPVPASYAREGRAMRDALAADLQALDDIEVVMTVDPRFPPRRALRGVSLRTEPLRCTLRDVDAAWIVAPETRGCLETLTRRVESAGVRVLGSSSAAIAHVADKARLATRLARLGIPHPTAGREFPMIVKPRVGAGSLGVRLIHGPRELPRRSGLLVQRFVPGTPASVALLCDGRRARVLAVNAQRLSPTFVYGGGETPWTAPLAARAAALAIRACEAHPGLRGYVGVDVVLGGTDACVIEINPRLTTAYLGLRASLGVNVAGLALAACDGRLPVVPRARRRVRFSSGGRVTVL